MTETTTRRRILMKGGAEVEMGEEQILDLPEGLMGFPDFHAFALLPHGEESPFLWLQSMDEPELAFITMDPRVFLEGYKPELTATDLAPIGLESIEGAIVLSIVVIPEDPKQMTANLQGPLIINPTTRKGLQAISRSSQHRVRHLILGEPGAAG